ncbi:hypothetical protein [Azospirillum soli]|uniref:hypothetical protein n=1 Tax=Azospirillum soli TaxID=1304799 RepID=UPI001AE6B7AF|nr:hypothetical protein [Azospirillum soli]MBP2311909.1 hypothetical protein [Azospirillum soli]
MKLNAVIGGEATQLLCLAVAKATIQKSELPGGCTLAVQIGDSLADKLSEELASMLADVMPAAVVKTIGQDVLYGADAVGAFTGLNPRQVYHLAQTNKIPVFRMGTLICARKSTLLRWIEEQEAKAMGAAA